jgi:hypothetical protein
MKTILLTLLALVSLQSIAVPSDTLSTSTYYYLAPLKIETSRQEENDGVLAIVAGVLLTGIGVLKESTREPYPNHATSIDYNPDAPQVLNYLLIGSGLGLTGYGLKLVVKF